jgi:hypothetical protein
VAEQAGGSRHLTFNLTPVTAKLERQTKTTGEGNCSVPTLHNSLGEKG